MSDQYSLEDDQNTIRLRGAWEQVLRQLNDEVQPSIMTKFLEPIKPTSLTSGMALMTSPTAFVQEWVSEKFLERLQDLLSAELGEPVGIHLKVQSPDLSTAPVCEPAAFASTASCPKPAVSKFVPMPKFRFETFIQGDSNRLAVAGCKAVAAEPGSKYNPLFIYGPSGLGKTHLLHAIGHTILGRMPNFPLAYISAQQFAEEFVQALQERRMEPFRRAQRSVNLWLVDDIQFIAGKDKTQEELFHTFNHLQTVGKQIVICSDRPPRELFLMDERLRSRFESGLVADIQMPDTETRCAILLSKARQENVELEFDIALYLATRVPGNIRILEGALTKLATQASLDGKSITMQLAEQMVEKYYSTAGMAKPSFTQILDVVSKHFKVPTEEIRGPSRKAPIAHARHIAVYVTREITGDSWKHIGSLFGERDHSTVLHGHQKVSELMARDKDMHTTVKMLMRNLSHGG